MTEKNWEEMSIEEKIDSVRNKEIRALCLKMVHEDRCLADLIGQQARRIDELKEEIEKLKKANLLLG